jgi:CheY-like chemotaxis protein
LLVEPEELRRALLASHLAASGREVVAVASFTEAREQLKATPFDLIVTATRLSAFNGLHLVLLARAAYPSIAAVITTPTPDEVLQREATGFAAGFAAAPWDNLAVLDAALGQASAIQPV